MSANGVKLVAVHVRIANWLSSSVFTLAGTVLLVCWLLAYALEPDGQFVQVGLALAVAAYVIDLVREGWRSRRESANTGVGV
jgi:hypothetical protein